MTTKARPASRRARRLCARGDRSDEGLLYVRRHRRHVRFERQLMSFDIRQAIPDELSSQLPETPHELPLNRQKIVELVARVREGEQVDLLSELLAAVDWRAAFSDEIGRPLDLEEIS